ncbi:hypothetical protein JVT61DRAFT_6426 [Boletus reticuloceps]|uniref:Uncharacterized protein n=1 Tax=Boletus reticuloceps TaxID=495285 RepID=A0A8I3A7R9_9AGAM|nr:hypothetical protein JVT61DRAFT_6426 [Boletus reticuloceps]
MVIELIKQNRISDSIWNTIINCAHYGQCTSLDLQEIRHLVLMNESCNITNFQNPPWIEAILITPCNSV